MNITLTDATFSSLPEWFLPVMLVLVVWTFVWKGLGMWHAARKKNVTWFVILMLFNTVGILDMIYLFGIAKIKSDKLFK